ncbi:hypothetical protein RYX36_014160, partial [Vicia faba]
FYEEAKRFQFKVMPNWNDIVDICTRDSANGVQVERAFDADDVMRKETIVDEEGSIVHINLEESNSATKKKVHYTRAYKGRDKEGMINCIKEVVESLKDFVQVSKKRMGRNAQEVV